MNTASSADPQNNPRSLIFKPLDLSDVGIVQLEKLLTTVWPHGHHLTTAYLKWMYSENPDGSALGFNAFDGDLLVGHYAAQPIRGRLCSSEERGLLSFNTAVHPDYRGLSLFRKLAESTYESAIQQGYQFVVGVSNANSTLLFKRQLRFQIVGPLDVKIGVGGVSPSLSKEVLFQRVWSDEALRWRMSPPAKPYRQIGKYYMAPTGKFGIWTFLGKTGLISPGISKGFSFNPIRLWIGLDPSHDWKGTLYFDLPDRFKPSPLNLIFKDLTDQKRQLDSSSSLFRLIDFDAY